MLPVSSPFRWLYRWLSVSWRREMTCWRSPVPPSLILHRHVYLFWSLSCSLCLPLSGDSTEDSAWVGGERWHVEEVPYDPLKSYMDMFICFGLSHAPCVFRWLYRWLSVSWRRETTCWRSPIRPSLILHWPVYLFWSLSCSLCLQVTLQMTQRELEERDDMLEKSHTTLFNLTLTHLFVLVSLMLLVSSGDYRRLSVSWRREMTCWRSPVPPSLILHRHVYLFWSLSCSLCLPWSGDSTEDSAWVGGERWHVGEVPY